ncbi:MAG: caspase family protein [Bryobacteraceae bacterium]
MSGLCKGGVFIGVDRQAVSRSSERLVNTAKDAKRLRDYFEDAYGSAAWRTMPTGSRPPKRLEFLAAVAQLAHDTPSDSTALVYFSGHAASTDSGLILKLFDTTDAMLYDSGVPLTRLFSILKAQAVTGKQFFVVLDCCRAGLALTLADDVPSNVCVLYACTPGEIAWETDEGGVLTRSILESLRLIALESGSRSCSVQTLCGRLRREMFAWRPSRAIQIQLGGSNAERIHLPISVGGEHKRKASADEPRTVLRYSFGTQAAYNTGFSVLAAAIFGWYGIPHDSAAGRSFVRDHIAEATNLLRLDVLVPRGCVRWGPSEFLAYLLTMSIDAVDTLIVSWSRLIDFAEVKPLQHVVQGEWTRGPSEYRLTWKNTLNDQNFRGVATMSQDSDKMIVYITCETSDCYEMPLHNLMPLVPDILDLFRSIV